MTTHKMTTTEETHLLEREDEARGGFSRRKQIASAVGVFALAIGGVAVAGSRGQFTSSPTYSSRLRAERRAKLGAPEAATTTKLSLSTGCSPLNKLPFDTDSDFTGRVAAKIVTKGMSNDFLFEKGQDMKEVSCGNYEVDTSIALNEEFGFYLFPVGNETDLNTVLDSGCSHEGDARCPSFATPSALAGLTQCTRMYEDPGSGDKFYNRVFDGEQTSFTWGSCDTTCAATHPKACPALVKEDGPHQYWRYRLLEKEYAWNVKEIQFFPDTEFYDETQSTVAAPGKERGYGSGSKCIQSGQYGSHGCDRSFDDNLYSWWSNWASGNEAQSWIGIDLGSAKPVKHVRFMNGRGWPTGKEGVIEFSDDMNTWTEWSGDRITTEARAQKESEGSENNKWQEAAVVSAPAPAPPTVAATGSKYWKVTNADALGWRPKVKNFGLYSDAACTKLISESDSELICSGAQSTRPCSNAATGKLPPLTPAERSIVNCDNSATSTGCRYNTENVEEEKVSWRPNDGSPAADAVWIGSKFAEPIDVKCAVSTGLGNVFNNGVDGEGFGGTSQGGKHRITLWKSDDGVAWEKVATSDGSNIDDVVVVP